ncbi:Retrovirus-related Pol polyprotein from transposon TNT 1-94 [Vitis vinifera]|uniref:Retrovirus-related Pol polyprotein from transposon TNT 1-94 n=1 Tax=Vitis vinifera TaxID=29760 RepID=A0A438GBH8_VITVI|nr:Retrovirus-related Pol polyprotein from transposon TNT 1-94 [Vitis vinifera]
MKFSSLRLTDMSGVREHIMQMRDIAAQLKTLEEEERLKMELGGIKKANRCFFCKKKGHMKKGCTKFQKWLEKKGYAKPNETNANLQNDTSNNVMHVHTGIKQCVMNEDSSMLWHRRLGHISMQRIKRLVNDGVLNTLDFTDFDTCVDCIKGKQTNKSKKGAKRSTDILEIIHSDICCPDTDVYGLKYFISFIDDYSRYLYIHLLHNKNETLDAFKVFKAEVEKQCGKQIKIVRTDKCGEYYGRYTEDGKHLMNFMASNGIWNLVELPDGAKAIGCKWVFKTKKDSLGNNESGNLEEEVYMKQLKGFSSSSENIMDQCICQKVTESKICFLVLYVDDILLATNDKGLLHEGDRFNLEQCPKNDLEWEQIKNIPYVSTVGSLMYAQVCTRPAIAFVVGMLGRYQSNPSINH